ncbi:hypothetical protein CXB51_030099 [Gossypium anomalum]|uniref:RNase H type-1 domain-containing protein n=1 Tax=Gossypium anomalum TaxID=47600 RepID=A0A8J6CR36_9ROSI|nr:hypothetical protein CXB51_030099 [Gossypium anomalum]
MAPERGWIKLNTDGVVLVPNGSTSIGGVFRDHYARWISGFTMQTREESVFKIETKAIFESQKITWDSDFRQIEVECDNAFIVEVILTGGGTNSKTSKLHLIHQFLGRDWRYSEGSQQSY